LAVCEDLYQRLDDRLVVGLLQLSETTRSRTAWLC